MRNTFSVFILLALGGFFLVALPVRASTSTVATYDRKEGEFVSAMVIDPKTNKMLWSYQPDKQMSAASLTKMMSAVVAIEAGLPWTKIMKLQKAEQVGGAEIPMKVGSRLSVQDAFYGAMIASANNATLLFSRATGLSQKNFIARMNKRAKKLGMKNSTFTDPSGLKISNQSTARDIALLAKAAFAKPPVRAAMLRGSHTMRLVGTKKVVTVKNTDRLLTKDPEVLVSGGKTGFLPDVGYHLAVKLRPANGKGKELLVVVMGVPTYRGAFASAKSLAEWAWNQ